MSLPLRVRRATVDDLPALKALWLTAQLPANELEGRLTEFQVVEAGVSFAGAIGLQIVRQHLRTHSEDYADYSVADGARLLFWERIQSLAANHGVFRIWTQETSPFWTRWGFQPANAEILQRLPDEWKNLEGRWLTLELKNEELISAALENRLATFGETEKQQAAQILDRARQLKLLITIAGFAIFLICAVIAIRLLLHHPFSSH